MSGAGGAVGQLGRLLALIPWLVARPGVTVSEAAHEFGVSEAQLHKDLELAFVCGLPGHLPDDLIDVNLDGDTIVVSNADTIARPLRFAPDEAAALLVGLRALAGIPGDDAREALDRTLAKLERAAGDAASVGQRLFVDIEGEPQLAAQLRQAVQEGWVVHLRYYVPGRDEITERDVDPLRLVVVDGRTYLEGWCHVATDLRLFRLDRIEKLTVSSVAAQSPAATRLRDLDEGAFATGDASLLVTLELTPRAHWVCDAYRCEVLGNDAQGRRLVRLPVGDEAWAARLLLRLGGAARVLDPPELGRRVAQEAAAALAWYEGEGAN